MGISLIYQHTNAANKRELQSLIYNTKVASSLISFGKHGEEAHSESQGHHKMALQEQLLSRKAMLKLIKSYKQIKGRCNLQHHSGTQKRVLQDEN